MTHRTMLAGGIVIDGTGCPPRSVDLLLEDDRIAAIGPRLDPPEGCDVRDITGLTVAPGFIDIHSHADFSLLAFPSAHSAIRQGVTTVATGNCGGGVAPISGEHDIAAVAFAHDPGWDVEVDWTTFGEYARRLDGTGVNVAPLLAHGVVRNAVMGMEPRHATAVERARMRSLVAEALDEGAFGMSTGLEYVPGQWSDEAELTDLVAEVGSRNRMYASHMRGRSDEHGNATAEALTVARSSGARLQLSHFASRPNAPSDASDLAFQLVSDAYDADEPVGVDTFPETWGPALLIDLFPPWVFEGTVDQVLERLSSSKSRSLLFQHFEETPRFLARVAGYEEIYIADAPGNRELQGISLTEIDPGRHVSDVACGLLLQAGEEYRSVAIRHIYATEADLRRTLALPFCSIESDGVITTGEGDECRLIWNASSYGYAARVLDHYVRDTGFFSIGEAVRRMTSLPAEALDLRHRGTIAVGWHADLVVFDFEKLRDLSRPDDPARHPAGFELVYVNGDVAVEHDAVTGAHAGRLLTP